jgi:hypothetical protein
MIKNEVARAALEVTRQWAIDELEAARARVTNLRCGGEAYNHAIYAIGELTRTIDSIGYMLGEVQPPEIMHDARPAEPIRESMIEAGPPAEEPAPEPEPEKPVRQVDLAEVRTKAKAARDAGVKLADVWAVFNATKLSEVPVDKYCDVLDILEEKMKETA